MNITIKPSDLWYRYPRNKASRALPRFSGKPDATPFDRNNLYEVVPMLEAVMDALQTRDQGILRELEELLNSVMPACLATRGEVYDFLLESMREVLRQDV
jgi:hypothetical protein